jgi:hypothetical protein
METEEVMTSLGSFSKTSGRIVEISVVGISISSWACIGGLQNGQWESRDGQDEAMFRCQGDVEDRELVRIKDPGETGQAARA